MAQTHAGTWTKTWSDSERDSWLDTWGNLPAITRPIVALTQVLPALPKAEPRPRLGSLRNQFVVAYPHKDEHVGSMRGETNARITSSAENMPSAASHTLNDHARRWSTWGAARDGARIVLTRPQEVALWVIGAGLLIALIVNLHAALVGFLAVATAVYLLAGAYKGVLLLRGERHAPRTIMGAPIADADLPMYSVLVPLHREGKMLPFLLERLARIDYPLESLEIMLLVEADDEETRASLARISLPQHIRAVTVPHGAPKTKPRALNVGLARARGEFMVVYDAEDRPEPDQLRKAIAAFRATSRKVICLQARLNFYNMRQSVVARLFAIDYIQWYYLLLPGLTRANSFVPLGGTSNHFRTAALRRLGGWDPYNVTEDCDLGARIGRAGLEVAMLDSTTWEEAVTHVRQWVRQRSRWVKGYIQTYFVHMRHPIQLYRDTGLQGFIDFQLLVGGAAVMLLVNPLMWILTACYTLTNGTAMGPAIRSLFPAAIYYPSLACFVFGNFFFFYLSLYVCVRQGFYDQARYALLSPLYWLMMSIGAWAGLISLLRNPHYWAKTAHGVSVRSSLTPLPSASTTAQSEVAATEGFATSPTTPGESLESRTQYQARAIARPRLSVVVPAYNEASRLPATLERLRTYLDGQCDTYEVIIVDDGSVDATPTIVKEAIVSWPQLHLRLGQHCGKGGAIRTGVLAAHGEYIAFADADLSMPVEEFARFRPETLGDYDVAIASREGPGAVRLGEPALRRVMSVVFNRVVQLLLLPGVRDTQCGFKFLRREVAQDLCRMQTIEGWGFDVELLYIAHLRGYRLVETPIQWRYSPGSKVNPLRDAVHMLRELFVIRSQGNHGMYDGDALPIPSIPTTPTEATSMVYQY